MLFFGFQSFWKLNMSENELSHTLNLKKKLNKECRTPEYKNHLLCMLHSRWQIHSLLQPQEVILAIEQNREADSWILLLTVHYLVFSFQKKKKERKHFNIYSRWKRKQENLRYYQLLKSLWKSLVKEKTIFTKYCNCFITDCMYYSGGQEIKSICLLSCRIFPWFELKIKGVVDNANNYHCESMLTSKSNKW